MSSIYGFERSLPFAAIALLIAALFAVAFLGSTPIGAPIIGAISQAFGPRAGLVVGGVTALVAGGVALRGLHHRVAARGPRAVSA